MKSLVWAMVGGVYKGVVKPILFRMKPDGVHDGMVRFGSWAGRATLFRSLARVFFFYHHDSLRQNLQGITFERPVGLSAGLDKNGEIAPVVSHIGFGFGTVGSVTAEPCEGNPKPWFHRLVKSKSIVVNAGLANQGASVILNRIDQTGQYIRKGFPVVLSVAKANSKDVVTEKDGIADYIATLQKACKNKTITLFEINISCPNTYGGEPFTEPKALERLLKAIDALGLKQPVFIKMPSSLPWAKFDVLLRVIVKHSVAGVTIANLAKDRSLLSLQDNLPDSLPGNLSGAPVRPLSNELIAATYKKYGNKLTIIGVGGVFTADDAYEKIRLGASLIDMITGLLFSGPQVVSQIHKGLVQRLERDGFEDISSAVGVDVVTDW